MKSLFLVASLLIHSFTQAQRHDFEFQSGFGSSYDRQSNEIKLSGLPIGRDADAFAMTFGLGYKYHLGVRQHAFLRSGIEYQLTLGNDYSALVLPFDAYVNFGKKFHVFFGLGVYSKLALSSINNDEYAFFIPGLSYGVGLGYRFKSGFDLALAWKVNADLSTYYREGAVSAGGSSYSFDYFNLVSQLRIALAYTFHEKAP